MYEQYWQLTERPFENTPDPRFTYYSQQHEEVLARMLYAVRSRKGCALFTGEYGCGKTLLSRVLWNELQKDHLYQTISILNPRLSGIKLLQEIFYQLSNGAMPRTKIDLFHLLYKILYENHTKNKHTVIVVDEAQSIRKKEIFEELRLLLNFQLNNAFLLTIIMLGSSELKASIAQVPQFVQRMAVRYHLRPLSCDETREYIRHRVKIAGVTRDIFDDNALEDIYKCTNGVPRRINTTCDLALLIGFGSGLKVIDRDTIAKVMADMEYQYAGPDQNISAPLPTNAAADSRGLAGHESLAHSGQG